MMETFHWEQFDRTSQDGCLFLDEDDVCFYYMKKPIGRPSDSKAGQLIYNIKIKPNEMTEAQRRVGWKYIAIKQCAKDMATFLKANMHLCPPRNTILVPMPPSAPRNHIEYDDRMVHVCTQLSEMLGYQVVDCFSSNEYLGSCHEGTMPRDIDLIISNTTFHWEMIESNVQYVFLVDDQLTKGTHFKAMKKILTDTYDVEVFGLFWAKQDSDYLYEVVPF